MYVPTKLSRNASPQGNKYSKRGSEAKATKKSLRELVQNSSKTHYKASLEAINGDTQSVRFAENEFKKLILTDEKSMVMTELGMTEMNGYGFGKPDRIRHLTKEVLRACNVIRPGVSELVNLPLAR